MSNPRLLLFLTSALALALLPLAALAQPSVQESAFWSQEISAGDLPPAADRIPAEPLVVNVAAKGRTPGLQGGTLNTMVTRSKDIRQMVVYGYARLVGYNETYDLVPDILESFENEGDRKFTLNLREGHKWSSGDPFTSADFEYWWKHIANNEELNPTGPPDFVRVEGELPEVTFPDATTVVFEWSKPNPSFLQVLAQAVPPFIYRPSAYLKQVHKDFADPDALQDEIDYARVKSWAALHNKRDNMDK
ncbi:MAG: ABC transporter substrate-binding protein, partial [Tritonibacter mobilis]|nr:ABC transporter substrate-binding protein [Tritonibacter mobilis]